MNIALLNPPPALLPGVSFDLPFDGSRPPARLSEVLPIIVAAAEHSEVRLRLPPPGQVRFRNLVHRGAPRPTSRVPSITLGRPVECESALEVTAAQLLDACPSVVEFGEQPFEILLPGRDGSWTRHIPDFVVVLSDGLEVIELKFRRDFTPEVIARTVILQQLLSPLGITYRLLSEQSLDGTRLDNAQALLRRARHAPGGVDALLAYNEVLRHGALPLGYFGWYTDGSTDAATIARLIMRGTVHVDLSAPLTSDSRVSVRASRTKEDCLWPAASN